MDADTPPHRRWRFKRLKQPKPLSYMKMLPYAVGLTSRRFQKVKSRPRAVIRWLYSVSYFIFITVMLGFSAVMPIDIIVRSTSNSSSRLAANTIIILAACVLFVVVSFVLYVVRLLSQRTHLQDIPRLYMPTTKEDIPESASNYIHERYVRSQEIIKLSGPQGRIVHPGVYDSGESASGTANVTDPVKLPDGLVYENALRTIGEDIKYRRLLSVSPTKTCKVEPNQTLRQVLLTQYLQGNPSDEEVTTLQEFLALYSRLRFSNKPIEYNQFIRLLQLWSCVRQTTATLC